LTRPSPRVKVTPITAENPHNDLVAILLRLAGIVAIASGLIGGVVWLVDLEDWSDRDSLRWGHTHNPFMQFPPFSETFLELSMWALLACAAAAGLGGAMLMVPLKWGAALVTWQARISIITNGVIAFFIVVSMSVFASIQFEEYHLGDTPEALALRLGSIAVNLALWAFVGSRAVRAFFAHQSHAPGRAFEVIMKPPPQPTGPKVPPEPEPRATP
jgi:hypothetical protein